MPPPLHNDETMAELGTRFGFNPTMIKACKRSLLESADPISTSLIQHILFLSQVRMKL